MIPEKEALRRAQALIQENQNEFYREYGFGFSWMQGMISPSEEKNASQKIFKKYYKLIKDLQNVRD